MSTDFSSAIAALRTTMGNIVAVSNPDFLKSEIARLSEAAAAPDLWDDADEAQKVTSELSHMQSDLERLDRTVARIDDLEVLVEMAEESSDEDEKRELLAEAQTDLGALEADVAELEIRTLLDGEYDERHAVVTIRSGAGGVDAADFAQMLMRMYLRWAERKGYKTRVLDTSYAEGAGIKSATFEVEAPYAYGTLSVEAGTHRLVRISPFDNQGRRQTSFAAVEIIPLIETTDEVDIPETELKIDVFRSSGPGGQSVNTTDSAVRITHIPSGIVVTSSEKSQHRNKEIAMQVLRSRLYEAERERLHSARAADRKSQVGSGDRSERIRTYNFPQGRMTDHRINLTLYALPQIMGGDLTEVIDALVSHDQAERLAEMDG